MNITPTPAPRTASVTIAPVDARCRYWCKIIRADTMLPPPANVAAAGASSLPGSYNRLGEDEIALNDIMIEGEANHHRRIDRGWSYWITWCDSDGQLYRIKNPGAELKRTLKTSGISASLLPGAGVLAACVRVGPAVRAGLDIIEHAHQIKG